MNDDRHQALKDRVRDKDETGYSQVPGHAGEFGQHARVDDAEQQQNKRREKIERPQDPDNGSGIATKAQQDKNRMEQYQDA